MNEQINTRITSAHVGLQEGHTSSGYESKRELFSRKNVKMKCNAFEFHTRTGADLFAQKSDRLSLIRDQRPFNSFQPINHGRIQYILYSEGRTLRILFWGILHSLPFCSPLLPGTLGSFWTKNCLLLST